MMASPVPPKPPPILLLLLLLCGCGSAEDHAPAGIFGDPVVADPVTIIYEAHGCYGTCPVYRVTVRRDGRGLYDGRDHVAVPGVRRFRLSPEQFRAFAAYVAPVKPARGSLPREAECNPGDGDSFTIVWEGADGARQSFCLGPHGEMSDPRLADERVRNAPARLPIARYTGPG